MPARKTVMRLVAKDPHLAATRKTMLAPPDAFAARNPGYPLLEWFEANFDHLYQVVVRMVAGMGFGPVADEAADKTMTDAWKWLLCRPLAEWRQHKMWLRRVAFNAALRQLAARKYERQAPESLDLIASEDDEEVVNALAEAILGLPEIFRSVYFRCAVEGHTCVEAAKAFGVPEGTIKSRLLLARKKLRQALIRGGFDPQENSDRARTECMPWRSIV